jgi:hypothetical protein
MLDKMEADEIHYKNYNEFINFIDIAQNYINDIKQIYMSGRIPDEDE